MEHAIGNEGKLPNRKKCSIQHQQTTLVLYHKGSNANGIHSHSKGDLLVFCFMERKSMNNPLSSLYVFVMTVASCGLNVDCSSC